MQEKLKLCPFCGGEAALQGTQCYWVICKKCGAETKEDKPKIKAINRWNNRVHDDLIEKDDE